MGIIGLRDASHVQGLGRGVAIAAIAIGGAVVLAVSGLVYAALRAAP